MLLSCHSLSLCSYIPDARRRATELIRSRRPGGGDLLGDAADIRTHREAHVFLGDRLHDDDTIALVGQRQNNIGRHWRMRVMIDRSEDRRHARGSVLLLVLRARRFTSVACLRYDDIHR